MAVKSYRLNAVVLQDLHNRSDLIPRHREIPSYGSASIPGRLEVDGSTCSHRGWRFHPLFGELLCAWHVEVQNSAAHVALAPNGLLHSGDVEPKIRGFLCAASLRNRRLGQSNRVLDSVSEFHRVTVSAHVDVHNFRRFSNQMVVESCNFDASVLQGLHHWSDFVFREDQIAHHHHTVVANRVESRPRAERKTRLDFRASDSDMEVLARHVETNYVSRQVGSWKSEAVFDIFPLPCGGRLLVSSGLCQRGCVQGNENEDHRDQSARPDR